MQYSQDRSYIRTKRLNNLERVETIKSIFFNHNKMKVGINNRKNVGKVTNVWKLNKSFQK
jgi:hypothetical protein